MIYDFTGAVSQSREWRAMKAAPKKERSDGITSEHNPTDNAP
jgi:hypothetical protein